MSNTRTAARSRVRPEPGGIARLHIVVPSAAIGPGDHLLRIRLSGTGDAEPRTDARLHLVTVAPTPGVVLLAGPADWDSRFLYRTLREVARAPGAGIRAARAQSLASDERSLARSNTDRVRRAARNADLLIVKGAPGPVQEGSECARDLALAQRGERRRSGRRRLVSLGRGSLSDRGGVPGAAGGFLPSGHPAHADRRRSRRLDRTDRAARPARSGPRGRDAADRTAGCGR